MDKMIELLNKLRAKPEPVRRLIAFWTSALIVFVLVSIWLAGLPGRLSGTAGTVTAIVESDKVSEVASPFAGLKAEFGQIFAKFKGPLKYESQGQ